MGGGTDGGVSMRYQHTKSHQATSHNRSSGFSSVAEIAGGMGLRSPQPQQLALDFAPAQVRSHGLRDAHTYPQVAQRQGASFRVRLPILGASSGEQLAFDGRGFLVAPTRPRQGRIFWLRFTVGSAIVRLSMSPAKVRNCDSARPESYASASATMCSISVARRTRSASTTSTPQCFTCSASTMSV